MFVIHCKPGPSVSAHPQRLKPLSTLFFSTATLAVVCAFGGGAAMSKDTVPTVSHVDLPRFMGKWYVIASIPTFLEKNAFNATESYVQNADGTIAATFSYHKGSFEGPVKTMNPRGWLRDSSNAYWGMRIIWPFKSEYRISYLDDSYSQTIIARSARDHVWIMARQPQVSAHDYDLLLKKVVDLGYDEHKVQLVPQRWP